MPILATVCVVAAFVVGVAAGLLVSVGVGVGRRARVGRNAIRDKSVANPRENRRPLASLVVETLDHGVIVVSRDELAVLVNPAARAMGILDIDRLIFPELVSIARGAIETRDRFTTSVDLPMGRLGREPIALSVTAVPLPAPEEERLAGVCLLLSDVSEQRRLEAVRRDFVANVSHELKTPVGALTLLAEAIHDAANEPAMVARFAARIQHEGARLAKLVDELMELSRVQGADPMPGAAQVDVRTVVVEAIERTCLVAEQNSSTVTWTCDDGLQVRGNEAQLATAVANLVDSIDELVALLRVSRMDGTSRGTPWRPLRQLLSNLRLPNL